MPDKLPERVISPRQAAFNRRHIYVPLEESPGKICAQAFGTYPPGVPLADRGERIDGDMIDYILSAAKSGRELFGVRKGRVLVCSEE